MSLNNIVGLGEAPLEERLEWALALARVVERMHGEGVIHKDINPSNVILHRESGRLQLIDLGIATRLACHPRESLQGRLCCCRRRCCRCFLGRFCRCQRDFRSGCRGRKHSPGNLTRAFLAGRGDPLHPLRRRWLWHTPRTPGTDLRTFLHYQSTRRRSRSLHRIWHRPGPPGNPPRLFQSPRHTHHPPTPPATPNTTTSGQNIERAQPFQLCKAGLLREALIECRRSFNLLLLPIL